MISKVEIPRVINEIINLVTYIIKKHNKNAESTILHQDEIDELSDLHQTAEHANNKAIQPRAESEEQIRLRNMALGTAADYSMDRGHTALLLIRGIKQQLLINRFDNIPSLGQWGTDVVHTKKNKNSMVAQTNTDTKTKKTTRQYSLKYFVWVGALPKGSALLYLYCAIAKRFLPHFFAIR